MKKLISKLKIKRAMKDSAPNVLPRKKFYKSKRFIIGCTLGVVVLAGGIFGLTTIKKQTSYSLALSNLAEARHYMKAAESNTLRVQLFSGMREENYAMDGKATRLTPFAIINADPKDNSLKNVTQIEGRIKLGEEQVAITLVRNPFDRNFATDLARIVDEAMEVSVTLFIAATDHPTFALVNPMSENAISWDEALKIASDKLGGKVGTKNFEVHVKIINDMAKESGAFWYIQYITPDQKTYFCVIAPDGSVVG